MSRNRTRKPKQCPKPVADQKGDKSQRRDAEIMDTAMKGVYRSGSNDPAWYSKDPQLVKDVASFPFGMPSGTPISMTSASLNANALVKVPGVMAINFTPVLGVGSVLSDPINVAATNLYTYLRQEQSASAKYEAADLMMYMTALDSLYALHAHMRRIYGCASAYLATSYYYPKGLLWAMNVDADDLISNLAQFRAIINYFGSSLNKYKLPSHFTYITRHQWMCDGMFTDSQSPKAQTYMFVPSNVWMYDNTYSTGTRLVAYALTGTGTGGLMQVKDFETAWTTLFNAIRNDEDVGQMSGDILKAFPNNVLVAPSIPSDYLVTPEYDERVMMQIHNSQAVGRLLTADASTSITQDPSVNSGAIVTKYGLYLRQVASDWASPIATGINAVHVLNYYKQDVTPDDVMEATRLMAHGTITKASGATDLTVNLTTCGSEIVHDYTIVTYNQEYGTFSNNRLNNDMGIVGDIDYPIVADALNIAGQVSQFDWSPQVRIWYNDGSGSWKLGGYFSDFDVYTVLTESNLSELHRVALLSEFDYLA